MFRAALVFAALGLAPVANAGDVLMGIDRLFTAQFAGLLQGARVGVLAHAASRSVDGRHLVDLLHERADLRAIFTPEHGLRSIDDDAVPDGRDPATGAPVFSLYGPRRQPTPEQLALVDVLVVDLQDVGLRYYTYPATLAWLLRAAGHAGKRVIVLDRPNPLGGAEVEGAMLEERWSGGIASYYPMPTRHGMTLGELARFYNERLALGADLTVVPMAGWQRSMVWPATGLKWRAPSPALPTFEQALLYALFGPLEATNLAVGRGKDNGQAFRIFGAPWVSEGQAARALERLSAQRLAGLRFSAADWVPTRAKFEGKHCRGFRVEVTGPVEGFRALIATLKALDEELGQNLKLSGADRMLGAAWVREEVEADASTDAILERARRESRDFLAVRDRALLY
jgi:uncharacterized protein YbbC (DUF1343 family)